MALNFLNIDITNISKRINFNFLIDMGRSMFFLKDNEKTQITSSNLKNSIDENTLFKINSQVLNIQNNKQEIISSLDCFYTASNEALCIIIEEKVQIKELTREIISNTMDFSLKFSAKSLILLLEKNNKDYVKIMQSMMLIGFINDTKHKTANLMGKEYKLLKFDVVSSSDIEEIAF